MRRGFEILQDCPPKTGSGQDPSELPMRRSQRLVILKEGFEGVRGEKLRDPQKVSDLTVMSFIIGKGCRCVDRRVGEVRKSQVLTTCLWESLLDIQKETSSRQLDKWALTLGCGWGWEWKLDVLRGQGEMGSGCRWRIVHGLRMLHGSIQNVPEQ